MRVFTSRRLQVPEDFEIQLIDERHDLAQQIFFRRDYLEMTQEALAADAGLTQPQIAELEAGHANPTHKTLVKLAHAFRCRVAELVTPGIEEAIFGDGLEPKDWWRWEQKEYTATIQFESADYLEVGYSWSGWIPDRMETVFGGLQEDRSESADQTVSDESLVVAA